MLAAIVAVAFALIVGGGAIMARDYGEKQFEAGKAACAADIAAKQDELKRKADELKAEAENHLTDMSAAFEAGEAQAKTRVVTIYRQAQQQVASAPVFQNPACVLPPDALRTLNAARASLRMARGEPAAAVAPTQPPAPPSAPAAAPAPAQLLSAPTAPAVPRPLGKRP